MKKKSTIDLKAHYESFSLDSRADHCATMISHHPYKNSNTSLDIKPKRIFHRPEILRVI